MEYKPSQPPENVNVSHQRPVREFVWLLFAALAIVAAIYWVLGLLVDQAVDSISPEDEAKLFSAVKASWLTDGEPASELQALMNSLASCGEVSIPITLYWQDEALPNAFALPGGAVVINSGLLDYLSSENALAFVLAHELGHFYHRDHLRGMGRGIVLAGLSVVILGSSSPVSQLLAPATGLGQAQFSQGREADADQYALRLLSCHYGHTGGATELFEKMSADQGLAKVPDAMHWFGSHPQLQTRTADIQASNNYVEGPLTPIPHLSARQ